MMRSRVVLALVVALLGVAPAARADEPNALTPDGAALLLPNQFVACPAILLPPEVLTAWVVTVGAGGHDAVVRPRFDRTLGDEVTLSGAPGVYRFPAPHIPWGGCGGSIGLDQSSGGLAIVHQDACNAASGSGADPCQYLFLDRFASGAAPGQEGERQGRQSGARLTIAPVTEPDVDQDLLGDTTEDLHDLSVAAVPTRLGDGRLRLAVTLRHLGGTGAGLVFLRTSHKLPNGEYGPGDKLEASPACLPQGFPFFDGSGMLACRVAALAPGATQTVTLTVRPDGPTYGLQVLSESTDLQPADNTVTVDVPPAPLGVELTGARTQKAASPLALTVASERAGNVRLVATAQADGRRVKLVRDVPFSRAGARTLRLRATGADRRALLAAAARRPVHVRVVASRLGGSASVVREVLLSAPTVIVD